MNAGFAIVGMACRYAGASTPQALWEDAMAGRRALRAIPDHRLNLEEYRGDAPDLISCEMAGLLEGYTFDRIRYRISANAHTSTDLVHWLALDVTADALADAGFPDGRGLPLNNTGVLLGNSLTGEESRAHALRLRWPYVSRCIRQELAAGMAADDIDHLLDRIGVRFRETLNDVTEETLAGGLANTIAGRICNYFDLSGGGFTVDGACASSLLAVSQACASLERGELDVAIAGGVDVSLDPFELVGFSKAGALATSDMRVFDQHPTGFLPGEGCGVIVLQRTEDAIAENRTIQATVRGWGISSDGAGGITRPSARGQVLALERAYRCAGKQPSEVGYVEAHGTGTAVGDATEIRALDTFFGTDARSSIALSSIKANIGHTKAAAGIAGLIKAAVCIKHGVQPPMTGCCTRSGALDATSLDPLEQPRLWPESTRTAGVSGMGFGGINCHIVLDSHQQPTPSRICSLTTGCPGPELFVLTADSVARLRTELEQLRSIGATLSLSELTDLAAASAQAAMTSGPGACRVAIVADGPSELTKRTTRALELLKQPIDGRFCGRDGVYAGHGEQPGRIGFLFPGQGSQLPEDLSSVRRRFPASLHNMDLPLSPAEITPLTTDVAQPALVASSLLALRLINRFGVEASLAIGHSLGELTALHWAGAIEEGALSELVRTRGRLMAASSSTRSCMAHIGASKKRILGLIAEREVWISCCNGARENVVAGSVAAVDQVVAAARAEGIAAHPIRVAAGFHTPFMATAADGLRQYLQKSEIGSVLKPLERPLFSTVSGGQLSCDTNIGQLLIDQLTQPVLFDRTLERALCSLDEPIDLWLEVGPDQLLSNMVARTRSLPSISIEVGSRGCSGLLNALAAAYAVGTELTLGPLYRTRLIRAIDSSAYPSLLGNPCEPGAKSKPNSKPTSNTEAVERSSTSILDALRTTLSRHTELPVSALKPDLRLLADLRLSSLAVSNLVAEVGEALGIPPLLGATDFSDATLQEVASSLEQVRDNTHHAAPLPDGVGPWIRAFAVNLEELESRPASAGKELECNYQRPPNGGYAPADEQLEAAVRRVARHVDSSRTLVVPLVTRDHTIQRLLNAAHLIGEGRVDHLIVLQTGPFGAGFARCLARESQHLTTLVVQFDGDPLSVPPETVRQTLESDAAFAEIHIDESGALRAPVLRPLRERPPQNGKIQLSDSDVVLVTGGAKGITAECARALTEATSARVVLIGRSKIGQSVELDNNLGRFEEASLNWEYEVCDLSDLAEVTDMVHRIEHKYGTVTGILHGAAINRPTASGELTDSVVQETLAPKVTGLEFLLASVDTSELRLLIAFGSVISRSGLEGEAHYALANEWLREDVAAFATAHPDCLATTIEWSVWQAVGMGARLGSVDVLKHRGLVPIPVDRGIEIFLRLLRTRPQTDQASTVVTGRLGQIDSLPFAPAKLPFGRFLETPLLSVDGVELVTETKLDPSTDLYLADHAIEGHFVLPAVIGLEAVVEHAMALSGNEMIPALEDVAFQRVIRVPAGGSTIRVAALAKLDGRIEVTIRSAETAFQLDHLSATCAFRSTPDEDAPPDLDCPQNGKAARPMALSEASSLYDKLMFQRGVFQRVDSYDMLLATNSTAHIASDGKAEWFCQYLPQELQLGDPGARDAAIHSIQACVPHARVLPVSVRSISAGRLNADEPWIVQAKQTGRDQNTFVYNLEIVDTSGCTKERWHGLKLRIVDAVEPPSTWQLPLFAAYLQRRTEELFASPNIDVAAVSRLSYESDQNAVVEALTQGATFRRGSTGRPYLIGEPRKVSVAHVEQLSLVVVGDGTVACDLEHPSTLEDEAWRRVVGSRIDLANEISKTLEEPFSRSAARVWATIECLRKADVGIDGSLAIASKTSDGWLVLRSADFYVASVSARIDGVNDEVVSGIGGFFGTSAATANTGKD